MNQTGTYVALYESSDGRLFMDDGEGGLYAGVETLTDTSALAVLVKVATGGTLDLPRATFAKDERGDIVPPGVTILTLDPLASAPRERGHLEIFPDSCGPAGRRFLGLEDDVT